MHRVSYVLFLILALFVPHTVPGADVLNVYLSEIPGQSTKQQNSPGMALEILHKIGESEDIRLQENFMPWLRAIRSLDQDTIGIIVPFARTPSRERKYLWI